MSDFECPQESEILEALSAGRWSTPAATSLRAHAAGCAACNELAQLAGAILDERTTAMHEAALPGSGLVWWRIQMRMRQDASRAASRMMTVIQAVVVAGAIAIVVALLGSASLSGPAAWLAQLLTGVTPPATGATLAGLSAWTAPILLAFITWLTLAPVAVWLAVTDD